MNAATVTVVESESSVPHILLYCQTGYGLLKYLMTAWLSEDGVALIALKQLVRYKKQLRIVHMRRNSQKNERSVSFHLHSARKSSKKL